MKIGLTRSKQKGLANETPSKKEETVEKGWPEGACIRQPGGVLTCCSSSKTESWESGTISTSKDEGGGIRGGRTPGLTRPPRPRWNPQGSQGRPYLNYFLFVFFLFFIIFLYYNYTGFFAQILTNTTIFNYKVQCWLCALAETGHNSPWEWREVHIHTLHRRTLGLGRECRLATRL